jgi:hypothetical protein
MDEMSFLWLDISKSENFWITLCIFSTFSTLLKNAVSGSMSSVTNTELANLDGLFDFRWFLVEKILKVDSNFDFIAQ